MIKSATGLKANVRNLSNGDDRVAKAYIRIFFMERFMERVSLSEYNIANSSHSNRQSIYLQCIHILHVFS